MKIAFFLLSLIIFSCFSCSRSYKQSQWDEEQGIFVMNERNLLYKLPSDSKNWKIADPQNLIEKLDFVGIDNETGVCIVVFHPERVEPSISLLDSLKMTSILKELTCQYPEDLLINFESLVKDTVFLEKRAKYFETNVNVKSEQDTLHILNSGYLFDIDNSIEGIMTTIPNEIIDSLSPQKINSYFEGLMIK